LGIHFAPRRLGEYPRPSIGVLLLTTHDPHILKNSPENNIEQPPKKRQNTPLRRFSLFLGVNLLLVFGRVHNFKQTKKNIHKNESKRCFSGVVNMAHLRGVGSSSSTLHGSLFAPAVKFSCEKVCR